MSNNQDNNNQNGFVAIFSVIFFALLAMVITVGFMRITVYEQRQALDNDLTSRALSAAEAGVEDAKRVLAYYKTNPNDGVFVGANNVFASTTCNGLHGNAVLQNKLGLKASGEVDANQNLYYTCLDVDLDTPDVSAELAQSESTVIPVRARPGEAFDTVRLQWHEVSEPGQPGNGGINQNRFFPAGDLPALRAGSNNQVGFNDARIPAYLKVQLIVAQKGAVTREQLYRGSRTIFLQPQRNGLNAIDIEGSDPRGNNLEQALNNSKDSPIQTRCNPNANSGQYACRMDVKLPVGSFPVNQSDYYLRVTSLYRDTNLKATLFNNTEARLFQGAQPRIDSTGRAADVFRRIVVRVNLGDAYDMPDFALETAGDICKQIQIASQPQHYDRQCDANNNAPSE